MATQAKLVVGRLGRAAADREQGAQDVRHATTYGASRLGLVPRIQRPVLPSPPAEPAETWRKRTFKFTTDQLARLKAYAEVTEQYQYRLVNDAVDSSLERAAAMLGYEQRSAMDKLHQQFMMEYAEPRPHTPSGRQRHYQRKETPPTDVEPAATPSFHWWWMLRRLAHPRHQSRPPLQTSPQLARSALPRTPEGV